MSLNVLHLSKIIFSECLFLDASINYLYTPIALLITTANFYFCFLILFIKSPTFNECVITTYVSMVKKSQKAKNLMHLLMHGGLLTQQLSSSFSTTTTDSQNYMKAPKINFYRDSKLRRKLNVNFIYFKSLTKKLKITTELYRKLF